MEPLPWTTLSLCYSIVSAVARDEQSAGWSAVVGEGASPASTSVVGVEEGGAMISGAGAELENPYGMDLVEESGSLGKNNFPPHSASGGAAGGLPSSSSGGRAPDSGTDTDEEQNPSAVPGSPLGGAPPGAPVSALATSLGGGPPTMTYASLPTLSRARLLVFGVLRALTRQNGGVVILDSELEDATWTALLLVDVLSTQKSWVLVSLQKCSHRLERGRMELSLKIFSASFGILLVASLMAVAVLAVQGSGRVIPKRKDSRGQEPFPLRGRAGAPSSPEWGESDRSLIGTNPTDPPEREDSAVTTPLREQTRLQRAGSGGI